MIWFLMPFALAVVGLSLRRFCERRLHLNFHSNIIIVVMMATDTVTNGMRTGSSGNALSCWSCGLPELATHKMEIKGNKTINWLMLVT